MKMHLKCHLENGGNVVSASMCQKMAGLPLLVGTSPFDIFMLIGWSRYMVLVAVIAYIFFTNKKWSHMAVTLHTPFSNSFCCVTNYIDPNFSEVCPYWSNWQYVSIGSGISLAPSRPQYINKTEGIESVWGDNAMLSSYWIIKIY